ncbi:hypothetical protein FrEUN1fDRAFT_0412 [Parafrankia sp. EUN1f]|nr:hypothetical protein FrEUN1fDRAFT_0412 [Parafrankia sp. EUN1f]
MHIVRLYLKVLCWMGLPTGLLIGFMSGQVQVGVAEGLAISAAFGSITLYRHRGLGGGDYSPRVTSVVHVPADSVLVHQRVLEALPALRARVVADDGGHIVARTRVNRHTRGERITVDVRPSTDDTEVTVRSVPRARWAPVDIYARGRRNVEAVVRALGTDLTGEVGAVGSK